MAQYELLLYMKNACGAPLLGDSAGFDAADAAAAISEADRRVKQLPRNCFGVLLDPSGAQIWSEDAPARRAGTRGR